MMRTERLAWLDCAPVALVSGQERSGDKAHECGAQAASGSGDRGGGYPEEGEWEEERSDRDWRDGDGLPPVQSASRTVVSMC